MPPRTGEMVKKYPSVCDLWDKSTGAGLTTSMVD
jgi:hypothetical protein